MCKAYRIPHSEFLGWDAYDRHKAVMHEIRLAERCPGCGIHPEEFDPERGGHPAAYEPQIVSCSGCETRAAGDDTIEQHRKAGYHVPTGTRVVLRKRDLSQLNRGTDG